MGFGQKITNWNAHLTNMMAVAFALFMLYFAFKYRMIGDLFWTGFPLVILGYVSYLYFTKKGKESFRKQISKANYYASSRHFHKLSNWDRYLGAGMLFAIGIFMLYINAASVPAAVFTWGALALFVMGVAVLEYNQITKPIFGYYKKHPARQVVMLNLISFASIFIFGVVPILIISIPMMSIAFSRAKEIEKKDKKLGNKLVMLSVAVAVILFASVILRLVFGVTFFTLDLLGWLG